jgi:hypothetical protein
MPFRLSPRARVIVLTMLGVFCAVGVATPATAHAGGVYPPGQETLSSRPVAFDTAAWVDAESDAAPESDDHAHATDPVAATPSVSVVPSARFAETAGSTAPRPASMPLSTRQDRGPPAPSDR